MGRPENMHARNIIWTKMVSFTYSCAWACRRYNKETESVSLKENQGYIAEFEL